LPAELRGACFRSTVDLCALIGSAPKSERDPDMSERTELLHRRGRGPVISRLCCAPDRAARTVLQCRSPANQAAYKECVMIKWAIIFFVISLIAGFFGFTGVAAGARGIAKILFFIAVVIFLIILVFGVLLGVLAF
jgi:uncharacterized membrane protein YtjA (UPF0391 family)